MAAMTSAISTSLAGLNGAVRQFEAAASRIAGGSATPASAPGPLDSVVSVGLRAPGGDMGVLLADVNVARYSFAANAKALTIINQTQKSLLDIKV